MRFALHGQNNGDDYWRRPRGQARVLHGVTMGCPDPKAVREHRGVEVRPLHDDRLAVLHALLQVTLHRSPNARALPLELVQQTPALSRLQVLPVPQRVGVQGAVLGHPNDLGKEVGLEHVRQVQPLREPCRDGRLSYSCCAAYEHDKWDLEVVERRNHAEAVHMLLAQAVQLQQREHFVLQLLLGHVQPSLVHKALFQFQHDLRCGLLRHPRGGEHPCQQKAGQDVVVLLVRHGCRRRRRGARRGRVRGVLFMGVVV
mmetsp:Transcript_7789/g.28255  ORF Transcript_7789/g.28255 Transcript_7789/m.28255 type:complete len:257 (+) Transcript_7789:1035-1805(+)